MSVGSRALRRRYATMLLAVVVSAMVVAATPAPARADSIRGYEWHLTTLRVAQAHHLSTGRGVIVGLVDSGVRADHPDLAGSVLPGASMIKSIPGDGRKDNSGHGTEMAGLIAGHGHGSGHSDGILGIAPAAKVLPVVAGASSVIRAKDVAAGIRWAADHGARVISVSIGTAGPSFDYMVDAVRYAIAKDAVVIAAAGNNDGGDVESPANVPGVIAVAATDQSGKPATFAARGAGVALAAPGVHMITTEDRPGLDDYSISDGTSQATAVVAGVAALVRARYPNLNAASVVDRLVRTARDAGGHGRDPSYGYGVVDPVAALTGPAPTVTANPLGAPTPSASTAGDSATGSDGFAPIVFLGAAALAVLVLIVVVLVIFLLVHRRSRPR